MKRILLLLLLAAAAVSCGPKDGEYTFRILTTNDVHGRYFDAEYVNDGVRNSLISAAWYIDSVRVAAGKENVILVDVGDFLQGDNAAYYYNYVDTLSEHLHARMAEYMDYDAVIVGNHDVETGHSVYDRYAEQLDRPFLACNAIRTDTGKPYFQEYVIIRRHGIKIALIGFTNPGIPGWLAPDLWEGMKFQELIPHAQGVVDRVREDENPDVVIVAVHGGAGKKDYKYIENPGMALFSTLKGVDLLLCAHDHRPVVHDADSIAMVNAGSHCKYVGQGIVNVTVKDGKVVAKSSDASLIPVKAEKHDAGMKEAFVKDFETVREFTLRRVGELKIPLHTIDAYSGMSDYINLVHTLCLESTGADISLAAPLTYDGSVAAGTVIYNDLFTIYPYENQLFVLSMTGKEIKGLLEYSYDNWINTYDKKSSHILKIRNVSDPRTGQEGWSFVARSYNFDSAAGICYEVDVTKPYGKRLNIFSMADGTPFDESKTYEVAMTSYRANGGGGLLKDGAGLDSEAAQERVIARYPEIREMLYDYMKTHEIIDAEIIGNQSLIGNWKFVPENIADKVLEEDVKLLFGDR
jgi:2',3'-cyclic-nucleotide 2'-phosphodiesterase/3'-nucleotidase